ncbi:hypothetical protein SCHPADRAFT_904166 [Schizopora paradoxa]|uniref:Uncharacterized protein n=1 Tax=Schizopora paradoxa TaxID=27342 RepID=A0A0H2RPF0_9AGAM|nr:hypothetical protein SCHPADRAFT_904166 [Schizopora paradoxa]
MLHIVDVLLSMMRRGHVHTQSEEDIGAAMNHLCEKGRELGQCITEVSDALSGDDFLLEAGLVKDWEVLAKDFSDVALETRKLAGDAKVQMNDLGGPFSAYLTRSHSTTTDEKCKEIGTYTEGFTERKEHMHSVIKKWEALSLRLTKFGSSRTSNSGSLPKELKARIERAVENLNVLLLDKAPESLNRTTNAQFPGTTLLTGKLLSLKDSRAIQRAINGGEGANVENLDVNEAEEGTYSSTQLESLINVFRIILLDVGAIHEDVERLSKSGALEAYRTRLSIVLEVYRRHATSLEDFCLAIGESHRAT